MAMRRPSEMQRRYAEEYVADPSSATAAAIRAGYSPRSAKEIAVQLMKKPHVQALIEQERKSLRERVHITQERVVGEMASIAFDDRAPAAAKIKALEMLAKWTGLFSGKTLLSVSDADVVRVAEELGMAPEDVVIRFEEEVARRSDETAAG